MQLSEARTSLCAKLNIDITDVQAGNNSLFSLADLDDAINDAAKQAWDYKPWTFTEKTYKVFVPSNFIGYLDYPNTFEDESVSLLTVAGVEFDKKDYQDYVAWFAKYPNDNSLFWTEHERFIFINGNAVVAGQEIDVSGKLRCPVLSASGDLLPFSPQTDNQENSGNVAVVHLSYAHILQSEKKKNLNGAAAVEKDALAILDLVWRPMGERKAEKTAQNRSFFDPPDLFGSPRRSRNTNIGNFP